eukprot:TRINITY_DN2109_c0_g2_i1.p1 TRINITY_DN2109_c0_g2~~TRINITY_DN2109_c0_g2_i1.p1  ORF type:complete len:1216 (+),score=326.85 TRINITY_DN2109_c0_g2_i1:427-3648(+)
MLQESARLAATETSDLRIREQQLEYENNKLATKVSDLQAIEREGSQAARQIGELAAENETLLKRVHMIESEADEQRSALEDQLALTERISQLVKEKLSLEQKLEASEEKEAERAQNQTILMSRVTDLICENDSLRKKEAAKTEEGQSCLESLHKKLEFLSEVTAANEVLKSQNEALQSSLATLQDGQSSEISTLRSDLLKSNELVSVLEADLESVNESNRQLESEKTELREKTCELQAEFSDLKRESASEVASLQHQLSSNNINTQQYNELQVKFDALMIESAAKATALEEAENEVASLQRKLSSQDADAQQYEKELDELTSKHVQLQGKFDSLKTESSSRIAALSEESEAAKRNNEIVIALEGELESSNTKNQNLEEELSSLRQQLHTVTLDNANKACLVTSLKQKVDEFSDFARDNSNQRSQIDELTSKHAKLQDEFDTLKRESASEVASLQHQLSSNNINTQQYNELQVKFDALMIESAAKATALEEAENEVASLQRKLSSQDVKVQEYEKELDSLKTDSNTNLISQSEYKTLEDELVSIKTTNAAYEDEIRDLNTKLTTAEASKRQVESLKRLLEEKTSEEDLHTSVIKNLRRKIDLMEQRQTHSVRDQHGEKLRMLEVSAIEKDAIRNELRSQFETEINDIRSTLARERTESKEETNLLNLRIMELAKENAAFAKEREQHQKLVIEKELVDEQNRHLRSELGCLQKDIVADLVLLKEEADRKSLPTPVKEFKQNLQDSESTVPSPFSSNSSIEPHLMSSTASGSEPKSVSSPLVSELLIPLTDVTISPTTETVGKDLIESVYQSCDVDLILLHEGDVNDEVTAVHIEMISKLKQCENKLLAKYFGVVQSHKGLYAVAERPSGLVTLQQYAKRRRRSGNAFSAKEVTHLMICIAEALSMLHNKQVTHRDLSSFQVCVSSTPYITSSTAVVVRRFGLTRAPPLLEFTSPESVKTRSFSCQNDIWSLGVVFWEILTYSSCLAFTGSTQKEVEKEILSKTASGESIFPQPAGCPSLVWDVVSPCFEPERSRPNAEQVLTKLRSLKEIILSKPLSDIALPELLSVRPLSRDRS